MTRKNKKGYQGAAEKKENEPSMQRFTLNDGDDSALASLAKKPAFRLEKAVP